MSEADLYPWVLGVWLAAGALAFAILQFISAPYGRHAREGWGPTVGVRLGWVLMEAPSPLIFGALYLAGPHRGGAAPAFLAMWLTHYVYRSFIYPFRLRGSAGKRTPLVIVALSASFNAANAYVNARWVFAFSEGYGADWLTDPRFLAGLALFVAGFAINHHSDHVLRTLRAPGETGYKIPRRGLYRWVSAPNYLGEIVEWTGWAIATWSIPGAGFALWTAANLAPRAATNHAWYRETFPDYPPERKALIPKIW